MEVRKKNRKIKFILDEKYLIKKGLFKDKKIKRDSIRSAIISGNSLMILTYENKIYKFTSIDQSFNYMQGLKLLVNEINKEDIVFSNYEPEIPWILFMLSMNNIQLNLAKYNYFTVSIYMILIMSYMLVIMKILNKSFVLYEVDKSKFVKFKRNGKILNSFYIYDIAIKNDSTEFTKYKNRKDGYIFELENRYEKTVYPLKCVNAIVDINKKAKIE